MTLENYLNHKLEHIKKADKLRVLQDTTQIDGCYVMRGGKRLLSFCSNDYLGLAVNEELKQASILAIKQYGNGAGAARLVSGNHPLFRELENKIAAWKKKEACLVFGSGYLTNIGIIPALMEKQDLIIADKLVHACLLDGAKLSNAKLFRFKHNDMLDLERILKENRDKYNNCLIITDEVFSMDGDKAPLREIYNLKTKYNAWLLTDGAHNLSPENPFADIAMGTFSKAFGGYGGYVVGSRILIDYLTSSVRSFIFTTGLPPSIIASNIKAIDIITQNPELSDLPIKKALLFTHKMNLPDAVSPIVPLIIGDSKKALQLSEKLIEKGYLAVAIRPPTVAEGTARIRFTFSALHKDADILSLTEVLKRLL